MQPSPTSTPLTGRLEKKGLGRFYKPWAIRDFSFDCESRVLTYKKNGAVRGAVKIDDSQRIREISAIEADGKPNAFEVPCFILSESQSSNLLSSKRLLLSAPDPETRRKWISHLTCSPPIDKSKAPLLSAPTKAGSESSNRAPEVLATGNDRIGIGSKPIHSSPSSPMDSRPSGPAFSVASSSTNYYRTSQSVLQSNSRTLTPTKDSVLDSNQSPFGSLSTSLNQISEAAKLANTHPIACSLKNLSAKLEHAIYLPELSHCFRQKLQVVTGLLMEPAVLIAMANVNIGNPGYVNINPYSPQHHIVLLLDFLCFASNFAHCLSDASSCVSLEMSRSADVARHFTLLLYYLVELARNVIILFQPVSSKLDISKLPLVPVEQAEESVLLTASELDKNAINRCVESITIRISKSKIASASKEFLISEVRNAVPIELEFWQSLSDEFLKTLALREQITTASVIDNLLIRDFWNERVGSNKESIPLQVFLNDLLNYWQVNLDENTRSSLDSASMGLVAHITASMLEYLQDTGLSCITPFSLQAMCRLVPPSLNILDGLKLVMSTSTSSDKLSHYRVNIPHLPESATVMQVPKLLYCGFTMHPISYLTFHSVFCSSPSIPEVINTLSSMESGLIFASGSSAPSTLLHICKQLGKERDIYWIDLRSSVHFETDGINSADASDNISSAFESTKQLTKYLNGNSTSIVLNAFLAQMGIIVQRSADSIAAIHEFLGTLAAGSLVVFDNFCDCVGTKKLFSIVVNGEYSRNITFLAIVTDDSVRDSLKTTKVKNSAKLKEVLTSATDIVIADLEAEDIVKLSLDLYSQQYPQFVSASTSASTSQSKPFQSPDSSSTACSVVVNSSFSSASSVIFAGYQELLADIFRTDHIFRSASSIKTITSIPHMYLHELWHSYRASLTAAGTSSTSTISPSNNASCSFASFFDRCYVRASDSQMRLCALALVPLWPKLRPLSDNSKSCTSGAMGIVFDDALAWALSKHHFNNNVAVWKMTWTKLQSMGWITAEIADLYSIRMATGEFENELIASYLNDNEITDINEFVRKQWEHYYLYWAAKLVAIGDGLCFNTHKASLMEYAKNRHHFQQLFDLFLNRCFPTNPVSSHLVSKQLSSNALVEIASKLTVYKMKYVFKLCFRKAQAIDLASRLVSQLEQQLNNQSSSTFSCSLVEAKLLISDLYLHNTQIEECCTVLDSVQIRLEREYREQQQQSTKDKSLSMIYAHYLLIRGNYYVAIENHEQAIEQSWQATELRMRFLPRTALETIEAMQSWAVAVARQQQWTKAKTMLDEVLRLRAASSTEKYIFERADCYHVLGDVLVAIGLTADAQSAYETALEIRRNIFIGDNHSSIAALMNSLGHLFYERQLYDQSKEQYQYTLSILKELLGENHLLLAPVHNSIGNVHYALDEFEQAKPHYEMALTILTIHKGIEDVEVADAVNRLAKLYLALDKPNVAKPLFERVVKIRKTTLGEEHPKTLSAVQDLDLAASMTPQRKSSKLFSWGPNNGESIKGSENGGSPVQPPGSSRRGSLLSFFASASAPVDGQPTDENVASEDSHADNGPVRKPVIRRQSKVNLAPVAGTSAARDEDSTSSQPARPLSTGRRGSMLSRLFGTPEKQDALPTVVEDGPERESDA